MTDVMGNSFAGGTAAGAASGRTVDAMTAPSPIAHSKKNAAGPTALGYGIELAELHKSFGPVRAVDGVTLSIAPGETVALLGPNGAGKSTTIDMLLGLATPDSGQVSVFGQPPADAVASGAVGAMLQTGGLPDFLTVRELITVMASFYPRPLGVDETLEITGIADLAGRRSRKLSGGQTQRVRFALAIVANPDLLLLDEPTVAMDVQVRHEFWTTMRAYASRGKTVVFATHYLEEADAYADRIVLMARGGIVADGSVTQLRAMTGHRRIRATLSAPLEDLRALPGVATAALHGDVAVLECDDSDATIRTLIARYPDARDIEIASAGLEQAFLALTADDTAIREIS
jgi:ABC-2 type transport system ATP-binding protein